MILRETIDNRGLKVIEFRDICDIEFSIKKCPNELLQININDSEPSILKYDPDDNREEWIDYSIPEDTYVNIKIHLSKEQVKEIIPILCNYAYTGELKADAKITKECYYEMINPKEELQ